MTTDARNVLEHVDRSRMLAKQASEGAKGLSPAWGLRMRIGELDLGSTEIRDLIRVTLEEAAAAAWNQLADELEATVVIVTRKPPPLSEHDV